MLIIKKKMSSNMRSSKLFLINKIRLTTHERILKLEPQRLVTLIKRNTRVIKVLNNELK